MEGPFINRRAYMYGHTFFEQEVPYYNSTACHHKPPIRQFPDNRPFDDGSEYKEDPANTDSTDGNLGVARGSKDYMIVDIESQIIKSLKITLYGLTEEEDRVYTLEVGKRYAITYITQQGIRTADGYLRFLSTSIPDDCTRYIGNYSNSALQAFLGMDCSTKGVSDKRKIYVVTIRDIKPLEDDSDYTPPTDENSANVMLSEVLARLNKATKELEALNKSDICMDVLENIDEVKTKISELNGIYAVVQGGSDSGEIFMEDLDNNTDSDKKN